MMQQPMYPAVANSPTTETSVAINDTATSITVLDTSKLPAGPNIATIGVDESAETVQYSGKAGNTLTGVVRGFNGTTAKSWPVGTRIARNYSAYDHDAARQNIESLASDTATDLPPVPITLSPGLQRIDSDRQARLAHVGFNGRTLVNILGRDGGCESLAPFTPAGGGGARELSTSIKKSGNASIKFAAVPGSGQIYTLKDYAYTLESTKYYLLTAWVYIVSINTSSSISFTLSIRDYETLTNRGVINADTSKVGSWQLLVLRIPINQGFVGAGFRLLFGITTNTGTPEGVAYFDEISLYEITGADYNAIGSMTPEQVAARWPYTEGISNVDNVQVKSYGRNLLKGKPDTLHSQFVLNAPYDLTLTPSSGYRMAVVDSYLPALPNTVYTASFTATSSIAGNYVYMSIGWIDAAGKRTYLGEAASSIVGPVNVLKTITTPTGCVALEISLSNANLTGTPTIRHQDWKLELGATKTPFQPNDDQSLFAWGVDAGSYVDGGGADKVYTDVDGRLRIRRWWRKIELTGNLAYSNVTQYVGFKRILLTDNRLLAASLANFSQRFVKSNMSSMQAYNYDGSAWASGDRFAMVTAGQIMHTISMADSGWGDSFEPNAAEMAAYHYGYRMNNGTFGTPYNGSGVKTWTRWDATSNAGALTTVPTTQAAGYTPYQLQFLLSTPVDEPISQEGAITLLAGANQLEMGSGVIVREPVTASLYQGIYYTNVTTTPVTQFKYRVGKILAIYKNGVVNTKWLIETHAEGYGLQRAKIPAADYDPSAVYTVTYLALDSYLTGIAPLAITGDRAANTRGAVDDVIDTQADMLGRLDVLDSGVQASYDRGSVGVSAAANAQAKADAALPASSYTAADVLTKIKAVDGTGSGLDADLLDGLHASSFMRVPSVIAVGDDLNTYTTAGFYMCQANVTANSLSNCPTSSAFSLLVERHAGTKQTLTEYEISGTARTYTRNQYGASWGNWYKVWDARSMGAGSGHNADLLDGKQASDFAPSGFGIGTNATYISGQNLDNFLYTGFYNGENCINAPSAGWYYYVMIRHNDGVLWIKQLAYSFNGNAAYTRTCSNGSWSGWSTTLSSDNTVQTRLNSGSLEYYDGSGWQTVGYDPSKYIPINRWNPINIVYASAETDYNVLTLTGKGFISNLFFQCDQSQSRVSIRVDGVNILNSSFTGSSDSVGGLVMNSELTGSGSAFGPVAYRSKDGYGNFSPADMARYGKQYNPDQTIGDYGDTTISSGRVTILSSPLFFKSKVEMFVSTTSTGHPTIIGTVTFRGGLYT